MGETRSTLAVIGGGNMGAALVAGIIAEGAVAPEAIVVVESSEERRAALADLLPGVTGSADIVPAESAVSAVKPP
ncbi:MAG: NAD(P)-binding domain-containing protein, partial [Ilumatobacteraceae bacterium]